MFRSIRWTLQMWHAAILASVLVVFGSVVFYLLSVTTYQRIEAELIRYADGVRPVRFMPRDSSKSEAQPAVADARKTHSADQPPPADAEPKSKAETRTLAAGPNNSESVPAGRGAKEIGLLEPGPREFGGREFMGRGRRGERPEMRFEPNEDIRPAFEEQSDTPYYYAVFRPDGSLQYKSKFAPDEIGR